MSGYKEALEAAGVTVLAFEEFGAYQGDWWAKVAGNGANEFINGNYGSCSACDAFEGEFGWEGTLCDAHAGAEYRTDLKDCPACIVAHQLRLADFGKSYLEGSSYTYDEAIKNARANEAWDSDATKMVAWIEGQK